MPTCFDTYVQKIVCSFIFFTLIFSTTLAHASLVVTGTRVIFAPGSVEATVPIRNEGKTPVLMQAWIDNGGLDDSPDNLKTPFLLTPPLSRIDPDKGQVLRVLTTDNQFAADRESVYWLNVLEIRPKPENASENSITFNYRSRIKLFYRRAGLKGIPLEKSADSLKFYQVGNKLQIKNDGPHYVTLNSTALISRDKKIEIGVGMVAPFSTLSLDITENVPVIDGIVYRYISDYGASVEQKAKLSVL